MNTDFCIVGGGMVGLSIANQLLEKEIAQSILIIDKEPKLGLHSSGLNSGVLHAGIYYEPNSLKAKVCVEGSRRLKQWVKERSLPLNECGKVIVPQNEDLDSQIDLLYERGEANGATVEIWDKTKLKEFLPLCRSASGRALWSPNTAVVKPKIVLERLESELREKGVIFQLNQPEWEINPLKREITLNNNEKVAYGHLINCAGLRADEVAYKFDIGLDYKLLPFKGLYWQIKNNSKIKINTNLYPVPDLNVPFLGVHFTPSADIDPVINIGPTATPALGRENYHAFENVEPLSAVNNLLCLINQYFLNEGGFRKYVHQQSLLFLKPLMLKEAKKLIPSISSSDLKFSNKVGIRPQLFNKKNKKLENDFICLSGENSTHVMNAISPAFTASFSLADLIIDRNKDKF